MTSELPWPWNFISGIVDVVSYKLGSMRFLQDLIRSFRPEHSLEEEPIAFGQDRSELAS